MSTNASAGAIVFLLTLSAACGSSAPTSPTAATSVTTTPTPSATFPPLSGPSRTFAFDHQLSYAVSDYTKESQFVLYDNGAFLLRFPTGEYRGAYSSTNGAITFQWEGTSVAGAWGATGTLESGTLTVVYNPIMELTDFENGVYVQAP
jgi:hypothetical protein